jgi:hypothetical protein
MKKTTLTAALVASALTAIVAVPQTAGATTRHHYTHHRTYSGCEAWRHKKANQGTVTGAVAGGVLGNLVAGHGNRTGGTIIGAGLGAVAGHHIAAHNHRCR